MLVMPVDGRLVRDPKTNRVVPAEGLQVNERDPFWIRRLAQSDVVQKPSMTLAPLKALPPAAPEAPAPTHLETGSPIASSPSQEKPQ